MFNICCPIRIILLWLFLRVICMRCVVIEPLQFSNQMLLPNRQLASKGIIDQLQKNQVEMKHREERWQRAEEQFMIRKERRQPRKTDLKQNISPSLFYLIEIQLIKLLAVFLAFETALFLTILFNCALAAMYLSHQVWVSDKKSLRLQLLQGNASSKYSYASQQLEE